MIATIGSETGLGPLEVLLGQRRGVLGHRPVARELDRVAGRRRELRPEPSTSATDWSSVIVSSMTTYAASPFVLMKRLSPVCGEPADARDVRVARDGGERRRDRALERGPGASGARGSAEEDDDVLLPAPKSAARRSATLADSSPGRASRPSTAGSTRSREEAHRDGDDHGRTTIARRAR